MSLKEPKVYIIKSNQSKMCYIGSCSNYLSIRFNQHKYYYNKWMDGNDTHNYSSFLIFNDDPEAVGEVIEYCSKEVMKERESYFIKKYKEDGWDVVNICDAVIDKERRNERMRKYYASNPDKYNKRAMTYYYLNRDKILEKRKKEYSLKSTVN